MRLFPALDGFLSTVAKHLRQILAVVLVVAGLVLIPVGVAVTFGVGFGVLSGGVLALTGGLLLDRTEG